MFRSILAAGAMVMAIAQPASANPVDGFLGWVDEETVDRRKGDMIAWSVVDSIFGAKVSIKNVTRGSANPLGQTKAHVFLELPESLEIQLDVTAYLKGRDTSPTGVVSDDYLNLVAQRFTLPVQTQDGLILGHKVTTRHTFTLPEGQMGLHMNPFAGMAHPDCSVGDCNILGAEIVEMVAAITVLTDFETDDVYNNVSRIVDGQIVYRDMH